MSSASDSSAAFARALVAGLPEELRASLSHQPGVEDSLQAIWQRVSDGNPKCALSPEIVAAHFATHLAAREPSDRDALETLGQLCVEDLALAAMCAEGDARAIAVFEKSVMVTLPAILARGGAKPADVEDSLQLLREHLLVRKDDRPPKIASYAGQGRLKSWTRITAIRMMRNHLRKSERLMPVEPSDLWDRLLPSGDPELEHLKERYRDEFREALGRAVGALSDRDRMLLKQAVVDGLTGQQLGDLHRVHRATASRWVVTAQEALLSTTRRELMSKLKVNRDELASILRLIQSRFDTGVGGALLRGTDTPDE